MTTLIRTRLVGYAALLAAAALATPAEPNETPGRPRCARIAATEGERPPLDEKGQALVTEALQDEYQGEAIYARVLEDLGDIRPFSNVVHAEQRHAGLLEDLLKARSLAVPGRGVAEAEMPAYASRREACQAAVEFEVGNVALYDRLLADDTLPGDVRTVFEHNRVASLDHHKPAFERCAAGGGRAAVSSGSGRGGGRGYGYGKGRQGRGGGAGCGGCGCATGGGCGWGAGSGRGHRHRGGGPTSSAPAESGS